MENDVSFRSRELAAFHEAGHVETALSVGARVDLVELLVEGKRHYGRIRVERTDGQKMHISLGGFAAAYVLFKRGRLLKEDGTRPTEKEFLNHAANNSFVDRQSFFGCDALIKDSQFDIEQDRQFMKYAVGRATNNMRFDFVELIADALLLRGRLEGHDLEAIIEL